MGKIMGAAMLTLPLILVGCGERKEETADEDAEVVVVAATTHEASYTADGELIRPHDWREWIFVGMPVTPNALTDGKAVLPEAQAVYIGQFWRK